MEQYKNASLNQISPKQQNPKSSPLTIDVSKPYQHKQIDTRWVQLKINGKLTSRSYFGSCIQAGKVYIYGGYNQQKGILSDFIQAQFYDLPSQWMEIKVKNSKSKNPPPLRNHTICSYMSNIILFGGQRSMLQNNNNFYKFDLRVNQWQLLKATFQQNNQSGSNNNTKHHISLDSHIAFIYNNSMYIFGGYQSQQGVYSNTLYEVNLKNINNNQVSIKQVTVKNYIKPKPRGNFYGSVVDNQLFIYGGTNSDLIFDDMWIFNFTQSTWKQIPKPQNPIDWPDKRKGHVMVAHPKSNYIFMFGGIRQITKQQNDIMVFNVQKLKWIRIHKNTNELYQPSPTIKKQVQQSPSIIDAKIKKNQKSVDHKKKEPFKLGIKSVTVYGKSMTQSYQSSGNNGKHIQTQYGAGFGQTKNTQSKKHMSLVQQKKMRQFLNRKKKLLSEVNQVSLDQYKKKRTHSPTSQTIIYSIDTIGQQKKYPQNFHEQLPKVIFDKQKGALIGKKPCARDGHAGLVYEDNIIIIGGDRHMMSFSDVYLFKMDKALNSIHLYQ